MQSVCLQDIANMINDSANNLFAQVQNVQQLLFELRTKKQDIQTPGRYVNAAWFLTNQTILLIKDMRTDLSTNLLSLYKITSKKRIITALQRIKGWVQSVSIIHWFHCS